MIGITTPGGWAGAFSGLDWSVYARLLSALRAREIPSATHKPLASRSSTNAPSPPREPTARIQPIGSPVEDHAHADQARHARAVTVDVRGVVGEANQPLAPETVDGAVRVDERAGVFVLVRGIRATHEDVSPSSRGLDALDGTEDRLRARRLRWYDAVASQGACDAFQDTRDVGTQQQVPAAPVAWLELPDGHTEVADLRDWETRDPEFLDQH